ncbi:hypothetical protein LFM09_46285 [Lentzea alba]|uniref:hypothetical protein n=1 Tax=Lentzea alba TaxID=2714351 RepID=UPI0039BFCA01
MWPSLVLSALALLVAGGAISKMTSTPVIIVSVLRSYLRPRFEPPEVVDPDGVDLTE